MTAWLSLLSKVQMICWCHCHLIVSFFIQVLNGLTFCYWYTPVILKEGLLSLLGFRYSVHLIHVHTHICRCNSDVIVLVSVKVEWGTSRLCLANAVGCGDKETGGCVYYLYWPALWYMQQWWCCYASQGTTSILRLHVTSWCSVWQFAKPESISTTFLTYAGANCTYFLDVTVSPSFFGIGYLLEHKPA